MRTPSKKPTEQPASVKDKARTVLVCGAIGAMGVWMTVRPQSPFHAAIERGEPVRFVIAAIDWIWSVPGGIVLAVLSLVAVGYELWPKTDET